MTIVHMLRLVTFAAAALVAAALQSPATAHVVESEDCPFGREVQGLFVPRCMRASEGKLGCPVLIDEHIG